MKLYHATSSIDVAEKIMEDGFLGANVYEYEDVVFFADRPLEGFGGWRSAWIAVEVPDEALNDGEYDESFWDNEQYRANCYCYTAERANAFPRRLYIDTVPGYGDEE